MQQWLEAYRIIAILKIRDFVDRLSGFVPAQLSFENLGPGGDMREKRKQSGFETYES
jgi:hypothetical protein